jgi:cytochrome bd ubiquinol oxidase subunit I
MLSTLVAFVVVYTVFITAFLYFSFRVISRGPNESPAHALASGSLKHAFMPKVLDHPSRTISMDQGG